jgi:hypothetical protein
MVRLGSHSSSVERKPYACYGCATFHMCHAAPAPEAHGSIANAPANDAPHSAMDTTIFDKADPFTFGDSLLDSASEPRQRLASDGSGMWVAIVP